MSHYDSWGVSTCGRQAAALQAHIDWLCRISVAGKLWGPALLLARTCGDKAFTETAAAMAEGSITAGSPLHTLALLMSGKCDAVHAGHAEPAAGSEAEQSSSPFAQAVQSRSAALLSQWQGNLAIMAANRVAGDEAAMVKLGDRLWRERSQVCFLQSVAGAMLVLLPHVTILRLRLLKVILLTSCVAALAEFCAAAKQWFSVSVKSSQTSSRPSNIQQLDCQHLC